jgi:hypothetical protein
MAYNKDEIWLQLHSLSAALDDAGLTRSERLTYAIGEFQRMPPTVRREMVRELRSVAADLLDLEPLIVAAQNEMETPRPAAQLEAS